MSRDVHSRIHWLNTHIHPPSPAFNLVSYWSAKIDDISLWPPDWNFYPSYRKKCPFWDLDPRAGLRIRKKSSKNGNLRGKKFRRASSYVLTFKLDFEEVGY